MTEHSDDNYMNTIVALAFLCVGVIGIWLHSRNVSRVMRLKKVLPPGSVVLHYHLLVACLGIILPFPFGALCTFFKRWLFGSLGCQLYAFEGMFTGECIISLACTISFLHMINYTKCSLRQKLKPIHYNMIALANWIFGFIIAILPLLGFGRYGLEPHKTSCLFSWMNMDSSTYWFIILIFTVGYLVPMSFGFYSLSKTMQLASHEDDHSYTHHTPKLNEDFRIITWLNAWIILIVSLSWLPFGIIGFQAIVFGSPTIGINSYYIPQLVAKLGTALMPMAYTGTMKKLEQSTRKE